MKVTSRDLHRDLRDIYVQFRGLPAIRNVHTEALWREIERLEKEEGVKP